MNTKQYDPLLVRDENHILNVVAKSYAELVIRAVETTEHGRDNESKGMFLFRLLTELSVKDGLDDGGICYNTIADAIRPYATEEIVLDKKRYSKNPDVILTKSIINIKYTPYYFSGKEIDCRASYGNYYDQILYLEYMAKRRAVWMNSYGYVYDEE